MGTPTYTGPAGAAFASASATATAAPMPSASGTSRVAFVTVRNRAVWSIDSVASLRWGLVIAGYAAGTVWLAVCISGLEVIRRKASYRAVQPAPA